jgi:hypothetical protein
MKTIKATFIFLIFVTILCCHDEKNIECECNAGIEVDKNRYYHEEIFSEPYIGMYGNWFLNDISGGFKGSPEYPANFDQLSIEEIGIFKFYRNDSLISFGKIKIEEQIEDELFISFMQDIKCNYTCNYVSLLGMQFYVNINDSAMLLDAPCCDMYNYHFVNEEYYQENP